ncbi:nicotinate-nucleotide adenylyltransferase [Novosphingobium colocasiae]|uniref:nicotinate-nucleotide adenylyltransferase n=1 Tax=Novosphingobium colocasiae TaxID=1256513 RepID=UPI0035AE1D89
MAGARDRSGAALTKATSDRPARSGRWLTGLMGGSFNPAHAGHRHVSLAALAALGLDEVWWLVSPGNPLKPVAGMAPLPARFASARRQARRAPIRVTAIERELGTRFTVDTLRALVRRYPRRRFVWLMGADNLAQLHRWKDWRTIARTMPIAVIARPGYDAAAYASPAMAWLGRYRMPQSSLNHPDKRSAPALVTLRFDPDTRSATAIRRADPDWARGLISGSLRAGSLRDGVTHNPITPSTEIASVQPGSVA